MFRVFCPLITVAALGCGQQAVSHVPLTPVATPPAESTPAETVPAETTPADSTPAETSAAPVPPSAQEAPMPADEPDFTKLELTEKQWGDKLSNEEYRILRRKGTERPFVNKYDHHFEEGAYVCAGCGLVLFESDTKFNSGCGWPAFYASKAEDRVVLTPDTTLGMVRTEVTCARCGGHLGHIFDDAPQTPTGQRYCINSVSIKFIPGEKMPEDAVVVEVPEEEKGKRE